MAGLNCDTPSRAVWPELSAGVDGFLSIDDDVAEEGMRALAALGIAGGECAGAAVGAARELLRAQEWREALGLGAGSTVLLPLTEGVTDPDLYARVVR
jgi:diaminopropionate ammonia-lyase